MGQTFATRFQHVHRAELISQPAVERILFAPGDPRNGREMKNSVLPINRLPYGGIVPNVSPDSLT